MDTLFFLSFLIFLLINAILIILTLISLPKLGDERKNFIKMKAQSYTFTVVIGTILIQIIKNTYQIIWRNGVFEGINPLTQLTTISIIYLISLLFFKKKYGA